VPVKRIFFNRGHMEIRNLFMTLWKWKWLFLGSIVIVFGSTMAFTFFQTPIYETNVRLIVSPSSVMMSESNLNDLRSAVTALSAPVVANTYAEISQSSSIVEKAWQQLVINPRIGYTVNSSVLPETTIVEITVSGPDRKLISNLANAIADQTITYVDGLTTVYNLTPLDYAAIPEIPVRPAYLLNLVLGFTIGLMAGVLFATMAEYLTTPADDKANHSTNETVKQTF
jgi:capsular polysaccharide biosynthesis protein